MSSQQDTTPTSLGSEAREEKSRHLYPQILFPPAASKEQVVFAVLSCLGHSVEDEPGLAQSSLCSSQDSRLISNVSESDSRSGPALLSAPAKDTSPYSSSSAVKPRLIPFGDTSPSKFNLQKWANAPGERQEASNEKGSSNTETPSQSQSNQESGQTTVRVKNTQTNPQRNTQLSQKPFHVQRKQKEIPSVVEECHDGLSVSAISWAEEAVKVGNFNLAKHTDPNNVIIYQVISKEEAGALIEGTGTFDTESPLLSHSLSDMMDIDSGKSERCFRDKTLSWKVRASLCVSGVMILATGLFVGIAVALLKVDELTKEQGNTTMQNRSETFLATPTIQPTTNPSVTLNSHTTYEPTLAAATQEPFATEAPTFAPSESIPAVSLYDTLDLPGYSWDSLFDSKSHHSKAFEFLQLDPSLAYYSEQRRLQRFVLSVFYLSTGGANWFQNDSWLSYAIHECDWWSITCGPNQEVVNITLPRNGLVGTIPPEMALLTAMEKLQLSDNLLSGNIPTYLGELENLQSLQLDVNVLSSTLPSELGSLTSLTYLNLTANSFTGTLPVQLTGLTKLIWLGVADNRLTGHLSPELGLWKQLKELCIHKNRLRGSLPVQIGKLEHMGRLSLYDNQFSGTIPTELALLTQLRHLELDANAMEGSIPTEVGLLTNLRSLWLSSNIMTGPIPSELGLLTHLEGLYLQVNSFTGLLASEIGLLGRLKEMRLFENDLRSKIPSELGRLGSLEQLSLGWNSFSGFIFGEIGRLQNLVELDLVANELDGTILLQLEG
jgi:hypothetical protein